MFYDFDRKYISSLYVFFPRKTLIKTNINYLPIIVIASSESKIEK